MLAKNRMALHRIPELGFQEFKTKAYLFEQIKDYQCTIHEVGETGLVLYFDNGQKETIAFRTDIDALPITEETDLEYCSTHPGLMHACGHDGHMAMLLELASYLDKHLTDQIYNVVLIFQPSEEIAGGAASIVASGWLDFYQVRAIFGFHLWPGLAKGKVYSRSGGLMAQSSETDIVVKGKSSHVAAAAQGTDALAIACRLMTDIYTYDDQLPTNEHHLIKFGQITGGTIRNVLANEVTISGSIRSFSPVTQQRYQAALSQLAQPYEEMQDCQIDFHYNDGYPAVINEPTLFARVEAALPELMILPEPVLQAEDFGVYCDSYPCTFFFLGIGETAALHQPTFDFEMDVLSVGYETYLKLLTI